MGLSGYSAKLAIVWFIILQEVNPTFTLRTIQANQQRGLSSYSAKQSHCWVYQSTQPSQLTVGFIRLSSQGSHMAKCIIRHNQANTPLGLSGCSAKPIYDWVYQDAQLSQYAIGFIRPPAKPIYVWVYQAAKEVER